VSEPSRSGGEPVEFDLLVVAGFGDAGGGPGAENSGRWRRRSSGCVRRASGPTNRWGLPWGFRRSSVSGGRVVNPIATHPRVALRGARDTQPRRRRRATNPGLTTPEHGSPPALDLPTTSGCGLRMVADEVVDLSQGQSDGRRPLRLRQEFPQPHTVPTLET
jgi:hypothetical protein